MTQEEVDITYDTKERLLQAIIDRMDIMIGQNQRLIELAEGEPKVVKNYGKAKIKARSN